MRGERPDLISHRGAQCPVLCSFRAAASRWSDHAERLYRRRTLARDCVAPAANGIAPRRGATAAGADQDRATR